MALKKAEEVQEEQGSISAAKAKQLFSSDTPKKEIKVLTTFSIEPSFKKQLEELFADMGLSWAAGIRFSLREFYKKYNAQ